METYKKGNFVASEIFACSSFILNTICVLIAGRGGSGPWVPDFNLVYWLKTILAICGLFYFFRSRVFISKDISRFVSISTLIILWYSIPIVNTAFIIIGGVIIKARSGLSSLEYSDRIPIQII